MSQLVSRVAELVGGQLGELHCGIGSLAGWGQPRVTWHYLSLSISRPNPRLVMFDALIYS